MARAQHAVRRTKVSYLSDLNPARSSAVRTSGFPKL